MMIMIILPGQILRCDDGGPLQPGPGGCQLQGSGGPAPRPGELPLVLSRSRDHNTHLCQVSCDWLIAQYSPLIGQGVVTPHNESYFALAEGSLSSYSTALSVTIAIGTRFIIIIIIIIIITIIIMTAS